MSEAPTSSSSSAAFKDTVRKCSTARAESAARSLLVPYELLTSGTARGREGGSGGASVNRLPLISQRCWPMITRVRSWNYIRWTKNIQPAANMASTRAAWSLPPPTRPLARTVSTVVYMATWLRSELNHNLGRRLCGHSRCRLVRLCY